MSDVRSIGKYQITGLIGTGGQGQVHSAIDHDLGREVAIKSLHRAQGGDAASVSRFRGEAKSLARIIHSNIATLIDFLAIDDHLYMVMELVHGRTLEDILRDRGEGLGVRESLAVIAQAADGLGYAHQMGVIHRDIKPSNLMVTASGRVKLMDFGIARVRGSDRLTRAGTAVGTPLYMSPEQCMGADGDERSDIYSLAIVLYELLTGAPPFEGKTDHQLAEAHIKSAPLPLIPRIAGVTPALESAIMKALAKKPEQRFASMRAFSVALGANALLADATDIVKGHADLTQKSTSAADAPQRLALSSVVMATAKSRAATLVRRFNALHPVSKGAGVGLVGVAVLAAIMLWPSPAPVLDPGVNAVRVQRSQTPSTPAVLVDQRTVNGRPLQTESASAKTPCVPNTAFGPGYMGCGPSTTVQAQDQKLPAANVERLRADTQPLQLPPQQSPQLPPQQQQPQPTQQQQVTERIDTPPPKSVAAEPSLADLRREFDSQNFGKAFELARKLAKFDSNGEGGDKEAQFTLGNLFLDGLGGASKSTEQAFGWFEKAASQGYGKAQYQVGAMLWLGLVSQERDCRALPWLLKSSEQNIAPAQYLMGLLNEKGSCGLRRNSDEAARYYWLAAGQGNQKAMAALRDMRRM